MLLCGWGIKAGVVHTTCGWTCGWQVKLCDPSLTHAVPERLRGKLLIKNAIQIVTLLYLLNVAVVVKRVRDSSAPFYRPAFSQHQSEGVHPGILTLMKQCWAEEPSERPSFNDIAKSLKNINEGKLVTQYRLSSFYVRTSFMRVVVSGKSNVVGV